MTETIFRLAIKDLRRTLRDCESRSFKRLKICKFAQTGLKSLSQIWDIYVAFNKNTFSGCSYCFTNLCSSRLNFSSLGTYAIWCRHFL